MGFCFLTTRRSELSAELNQGLIIVHFTSVGKFKMLTGRNLSQKWQVRDSLVV